MPATSFGEYLQSRRAAVDPASSGLPSVGRRRVTGLRREEVAALAGVNVDYYARLEQGREIHPSPQVLDALSRLFHLDGDAREHLYRLAGVQPLLTSQHSSLTVDPDLLALIDEWPMHPALIVNGALDVPAQNTIAQALHVGFNELDNLAVTVFLDPEARRFYTEWDQVAADTVAALRLAWGRAGRRGRPAEVVDVLHPHSDSFADMWADQEVRAKTHVTKALDHSQIGTFTLEARTFIVSGSEDQSLVVYTAGSGQRSIQALQLLGSIAATETAEADLP